MTESIRYQDDLYQAVNGTWEAKATIPDDKSSTGGFQDLADDVEAKLMADFDQVATGKKAAPDQYFEQAVALYQKAGDFARRDKEGIAPVLADLHTVQALHGIAEFNQQAPALYLKRGFDLPFMIAVDADMKNTTINRINLGGPSTILPDTTYYQENKAEGDQLLDVFRDMASKLLALTDLDDHEQSEILNRALSFDATIAKWVKSSEEWADYPKAYNPTATTDVIAALAPFDFKGLLTALFDQIPETIIVNEPRFLKGFNEIFNAETFSDYRAWLYLNVLTQSTGLLSEDLRQLGGTFGRALSGNPKAPDQHKHAYRLADRYFSEPVGIYYGRTYFGETAKADVTQLVEKMIATYKRRLENSDWLSQPTKEKAILKLDKMVLKMGYPDRPEAIFNELKVDEKANLFETVTALSAQIRQYQLAKLDKPVDRQTWNMPGHLVNASYDPSRNDITFPAAILQAPFYALTQSSSENLGGIGAVIAHEISHGFDNNGAQFDELGNMVNWWQEADYAHFNELTQAMIAQFDGLTTPAGKVNGKLIVSENIADAGGLAAALDTAQREDDADIRAFFINWARIWRSKSRLERQKMLLAVDVHAPNTLRANIQPRNLDAWYQTFDVQELDGMYLAPEKRIHIW